jgi:hypothetical protein
MGRPAPSVARGSRVEPVLVPGGYIDVFVLAHGALGDLRGSHGARAVLAPAFLTTLTDTDLLGVATTAPEEALARRPGVQPVELPGRQLGVLVQPH